MKYYMDVLQEKVDATSPFSEKSENYMVPCKNTTEAVATGAALSFMISCFM